MTRVTKHEHKSPQSKTAPVAAPTPPPKSGKLMPALRGINPPNAVLKLINPDPGQVLVAATEGLATEVIPAIKADHHLKQMLLRVKNLVTEGEGWLARDERRLVNDHIALIVTHYFERKKLRRTHVEARHHVGPDKITVFLSVFHGRTEATRCLEIHTQ